jgi:TetR/AcrR family transcriptional repressor of bet genes
MPASTATVVPLARKVSREQRRQQLIDATMRVLARKGYAQTTLSDVAAEARVSHGLVNFHFNTKEKLLAETLLFMAEEYRANWTIALERAGQTAAEQLDALLRADYEPSICTQVHLACWCSFWGEVQSRPVYQQQCASNDRHYIERLQDICATLIVEGGYRLDAVRAARVIRLVGEGLWLDMLSMTDPYSPAEAIATLYACAANLFPRHFCQAGLLGSDSDTKEMT